MAAVGGALASRRSRPHGHVRLGEEADRRIDDLDLAPDLLDLEVRLVLPGEVDVADPLLGEGRRRGARAEVEHRRLLVELRHELERVGLASRRAASPSPRRRGTMSLPLPEVFGFGRDDLDAGLDEVGPVLDALRVALADDEHDRRGVGQRVVRQAAPPSPARSGRPCAIALVSGHIASVTTSASRPSITARAWVPEPPCDCRIARSVPVAALYFGMKALLIAR